MKKPTKPDPNQSAARLVASVTGMPPPKGVYADLIKRLKSKKPKPGSR